MQSNLMLPCSTVVVYLIAALLVFVRVLEKIKCTCKYHKQFNRILEWGHWGSIISNGDHIHIPGTLIITVDLDIGLNSNQWHNAAYSCPSSIDSMHWSLRQSILQSHKLSVIKSVITVKFNISISKWLNARQRRPIVGRRAFSVAGARVWNALPADVTSAPSLFTFRKRLKLHLFSLSYAGRVH